MELRFNAGGYGILVGANSTTIYLTTNFGTNIKRCVQLPGPIEKIDVDTDFSRINFHCRIKGELRTFVLSAWIKIDKDSNSLTQNLNIQKQHHYENNDIIYSHEYTFKK